jgi:hypothetical protein
MALLDEALLKRRQYNALKQSGLNLGVEESVETAHDQAFLEAFEYSILFRSSGVHVVQSSRSLINTSSDVFSFTAVATRTCSTARYRDTQSTNPNPSGVVDQRGYLARP